MKSSNIIKLLAALLCVVVMFVSCADSAVIPETNGVDSLSGTAGTIPSLSDTTGSSNVGVEGTEPLTFSDFIEFIDRDKVYTTVEDAPEGVVDVYENFYLMYESSVDSNNQMTYSYEVVNIETGESYKKWKHTLDQANPDREIYVSFLNPDALGADETNDAAVIVVMDVKYAQITDEMRDESYYIENEDRFYVESVNYSVYDLHGNSVFENKQAGLDEDFVGFYAIPSNNSALFAAESYVAYVIYAHDGYCYLLDKDGKYDGAFEATSLAHFGYDYENEIYGYYLRAAHYENYAIQVYEKASGKLVYHKVYGEEASVNVLEDGKIFIQEVREAYAGEAYDFHLNGETYMLDSYTVQFTNENGVFKALETPVEVDYIFLSIVGASSLKDLASDSDFVIGDKLVNLAYGLKIVDRAIVMPSDEDDLMVFVDNDLKVQYVPEEIVPISGDFGFEKLDNGYSYVNVSLNNYIALYDPEGNFVRYLDSDNVLRNDFIVNSYGIFDYNFECLYEFDEGESVAAYIGDSIIMKEEIEDNPDTIYNEEKLTFYRLTLEESTQNKSNEEDGEDEEETKPVYVIKKSELEDIEDVEENRSDYIILYNGEDETYELYNRNFELLFISMNKIKMEFNDYLDAYEMTTVIKGVGRTYFIK